jgi:hypothetical protein
MSQGDLSRLDFIVIGDVRLQVTRPVLQLNLQASLEFFKPYLYPIEAEGISDPLCFFRGKFSFG